MDIMNTLSGYFRNFSRFDEGTKEVLLQAYNACKNSMDENDLASFMFALYYFCSDYHSGQSSFFYQIMCNMKITTNTSVESEEGDVQMLYSVLEAEFGHEPTF